MPVPRVGGVGVVGDGLGGWSSVAQKKKTRYESVAGRGPAMAIRSTLADPSCPFFPHMSLPPHHH